ncbi:hypothetical protein HDU96_000527 [Phlyctochytrium bullatum]|nr:hypothetical protein HDU96_000527 [Phlyctochytrium bullatum]
MIRWSSLNEENQEDSKLKTDYFRAYHQSILYMKYGFIEEAALCLKQFLKSFDIENIENGLLARFNDPAVWEEMKDLAHASDDTMLSELLSKCGEDPDLVKPYDAAIRGLPARTELMSLLGEAYDVSAKTDFPSAMHLNDVPPKFAENTLLEPLKTVAKLSSKPLNILLSSLLPNLERDEAGAGKPSEAESMSLKEADVSAPPGQPTTEDASTTSKKRRPDEENQENTRHSKRQRKSGKPAEKEIVDFFWEEQLMPLLPECVPLTYREDIFSTETIAKGILAEREGFLERLFGAMGMSDGDGRGTRDRPPEAKAADDAFISRQLRLGADANVVSYLLLWLVTAFSRPLKELLHESDRLLPRLIQLNTSVAIDLGYCQGGQVGEADVSRFVLTQLMPQALLRVCEFLWACILSAGDESGEDLNEAFRNWWSLYLKVATANTFVSEGVQIRLDLRSKFLWAQVVELSTPETAIAIYEECTKIVEGLAVESSVLETELGIPITAELVKERVLMLDIKRKAFHILESVEQQDLPSVLSKMMPFLVDASIEGLVNVNNDMKMSKADIETGRKYIFYEMPLSERLRLMNALVKASEADGNANVQFIVLSTALIVAYRDFFGSPIKTSFELISQLLLKLARFLEAKIDGNVVIDDLRLK